MTRDPFGIVERFLRSLDLENVEDCARRLADLDIVGIIKACASGDASGFVREISQHSYTHANGFDRISLPAIDGCPARLRFHIWPGETEDEEMPDAHNHRWAFASRVLAGSLKNELLMARPATAGDYRHFEHRSVGAEYGYSMRYSGHASLETIECDITNEGRVYSMRPATVHRVSSDRFTATLALELAPVALRTDVYSIASERDAGMLVPRRFEIEELTAKFADLYRRI